MQKIDIHAACSDLGIHINGSDLGPQVLLKRINTTLINKIIMTKKNPLYLKELGIYNKKKNLNEINSFNKNLYFSILNSLNNNNFPITIGGDHSISIASALASIKKHSNLGIIWFDAHTDFNTFKTTMSGNIHGLPLASITNYEKVSLSSFHMGNFYNFKNTVVVGARDIDFPFEMNNVKDSGITVITSEDIQKYGAEKMFSKAFDIALSGTNGLHISYDLDVLDPFICPGVSVPVKNGLSLLDSEIFLEFVKKNKKRIKSFDLVEFNPTKDINYKTEKIATNILNEIIELFYFV